MSGNISEHQPYIGLAQEIMRRAFAEEDPVMIRAWLLDSLGRMGSASVGNAVMTWEESFDYYDKLLAKREAEALLPDNQRTKLNWLWDSWNERIDPLEPGMMAVISAGDGQGKTIVAECLAEYWARRKNKVVFVHYELNPALMMDRRMARHAKIPRRALKSGQLTEEQKKKITALRPALLAWDGYITYLHTPGWTMEKTISELQRLKSENKCDVVVLDYLEKNQPSRRQLQMFGANQNQREADNVSQLKNFGEAVEVPIVMLAQLSKAGKTTSLVDLDRTDIRGAGEKTEFSNLAILLHREKINGDYSRTVSVVIDKNTLGQTGTFQQEMEPEYFRIQDIVLNQPTKPIQRDFAASLDLGT